MPAGDDSRDPVGPPSTGWEPYGGKRSNRSAGNGGNSGDQPGSTTPDPFKSVRNAAQVGNVVGSFLSGSPQIADATNYYTADPSKSTVLSDIPLELRIQSFNWVSTMQSLNAGSEAGGLIYWNNELAVGHMAKAVIPDARDGNYYVKPYVLTKQAIQSRPKWANDNNILATFHGHTNSTDAGQWPNIHDMQAFNSPAYRKTRYHITYMTIAGYQKVFVWDNENLEGYTFDVDVWRGEK